MALSTYLANKLLDLADGKAALATPTVYMALFITNPTAAGSGTEASFTGYARVAVPAASWAAAAAASSANAAAIAFATKTGGSDQTVAFWATFDALTAGNMLEFGALSAGQLIVNGVSVTVPIGALVRTAS